MGNQALSDMQSILSDLQSAVFCDGMRTAGSSLLVIDRRSDAPSSLAVVVSRLFALTSLCGGEMCRR